MDAMALAVLHKAMAEFHGDPRRVTLTGISMGGYGTWILGKRHPGTFAALAPICGGVRPPRFFPVPKEARLPEGVDPYLDTARRIGRTPVWAFHGKKDFFVPVEESRRMTRALQSLGGDVRYTEYPDVGHNAGDPAYADPELYRWLLSRRLPEPQP